MENEILEKVERKEKTQDEKKKSLIKIIAILLVLVGLIVLAIVAFIEPIKVSFKAPGKLGFSIEAEVVDENGKINVPDSSLLEQKHYIFLGWFDNADGKGDPLDLANMTFEESMTVYAIWDVIEYKIEYDFNGGDANEDDYPQVYTVSHDKLTKSDIENNNSIWNLDAINLDKYIQNPGLSLPTPTNGSKTFIGWQIIYNGEIQTGITVKNLRLDPIGDITLKAIWE